MNRFRNFALLICAAFLMMRSVSAQAPSGAGTGTGFTPLDQWKAAVLAGDAAALKAFYSSDPPAQLEANGYTVTTDADVKFWMGLKARSMKIEIVRLKEKPNGESVIFKAEVQTGAAGGEIMNVTDAQGWKKQGEQWRITGIERTDAPHLTQPSDMKKNIYPSDADAHAELKEAEAKATEEHKRILLVFGANWCYDCHVLDMAFQRPDFAAAMAGYEVVHIDLGDDSTKNADIVQQFSVPLDRGIPVLAVAESDGKLVFRQRNGEFEDARALTPEALLEFLNQWKLKAQ